MTAKTDVMLDQLGRYLNDHLAGSVAALELLAHLQTTEQEAEESELLRNLQDEIVVDRDALRRLIQQLGLSESRPRQALAWIAEQISEWKLAIDDRAGGDFRWFEALEALSLGIEGKRLLWRALAAIARDVGGLQSLDYAELERRAEDQRQRVEAFRLQAAKAVLSRRESG
jgi:hypothetical protein